MVYFELRLLASSRISSIMSGFVLVVEVKKNYLMIGRFFVKVSGLFLYVMVVKLFNEFIVLKMVGMIANMVV